MQLDTLKVMVTGGASGLGRCFVEHLAAAGAHVAACDVDADALAALQTDLADAPGRVVGIQADVADEASVERFADAAWDALGGCNALINNAGIFRDGLLVKQDRVTGEVSTMSLAQWQAVLDVDLTGPFLCTRAFAARHVRAGGGPGVIVNISSIARHGNPGQSNYSAAKAGLVADTALWAKELARHGVRVGAVAPGFVHTPILDGMRPEVLQRMIDRVPIRRVAAPAEIWQAVRFVLECDYFTGRCVDVDGGLTL